MVRHVFLTLFILLSLDDAVALSWRDASKLSKMTGLCKRLHRLSNTRHAAFNLGVKTTVYGSALLTLALNPYAQEGDRFVQSAEAVVAAEASAEPVALIGLEESEEEILTEQVHTSSWSIAVTAKGKLAHMHVQTIEEGDLIRIAGYVEPTAKGEKYFDLEPVLHYIADKSYAIQGQPYNGVTLPLRLSWLAAERSRKLNKINEILHTVAVHERALLELGDSMYRGFAALHVATRDDYRFENLASQTEIKFAGRRFFDRQAVSGAIARRHSMLRTRKIAYKQRQSTARFDAQVFQQAMDTYHVVLDLLSSSASSLTALSLNFDMQAKDDADFVMLVESLARFKLARLWLAKEILSLYEPFEMAFFYTAGMKEHLKLVVFADDDRHRGASFRYEVLTTANKHRRLFTLGQVDFDQNLEIKKMWISLKPHGGLAGFAKMTFVPCAEGTCPEPDFARENDGARRP